MNVPVDALPWLAAALRGALRAAPAVMLLPPLGRDLAGPLRPAAALVLALPVVSVCAHDAAPLGAGWLVLALRELLAGALLAGVLAAPWAVLAGVARVTEALGPWPTTEDADGPLTRLVVGVGTLSLLGLGAHRGVVRAVAASQAVFPSGGDPAAPWALDAARTMALRALTLATASVVELTATVAVAGLAVAAAVGVGARLHPAGGGLGASLRTVALLAVLGLALDRVAAGAAAVALSVRP